MSRPILDHPGAQTPAVLTAITGTRTTTDALDFNGDNFAEGDGYNAYLNTAANEVVIQLNKTLAPGNHVIFISHMSGLAVTLRAFTAKGGDGVDTLDWATESEFENLGYNLYRRRTQDPIDTALADGQAVAGAGIANALKQTARRLVAEKAAKLAEAKALGGADSAADTLPRARLSAEELAALGYERINPKLIPGAKGGSSASMREYRYIDRTATSGAAYEYLLEAVDFNGTCEQFGPRGARPAGTLATELYSNYPNPFNPITTLRFSLKDKLKVSLVIYNARGRVVRTPIRPDKAMAAGKYRVIWDARDEAGKEVASGQYFYRFVADRYVRTRKMILVK